MATVRTIEQWVFAKFQEKTGTRPSAVPGEDLFSVKLVAGQDVSRHVKLSDFLIETVKLSKDEADELQASLQEAARSLVRENFILQTSIRNETSTMDGELWRYVAVVQLRHRIRPEWVI